MTGWLLLSACAHEHEQVSRWLACPAEQLQQTSRADGRALAVARETKPTAAALAGAAATFAAMATMVGARSTSPTYYLPPGSVQINAQGWRFYEGCARAAICFDGGYCAASDEPEVIAAARTLPALMQRSLAEVGPHLEVTAQCPERESVSDRRGLLIWSLSRCQTAITCKVDEGAYACTDDRGRAVTR